jgi:hypothetical protein
VILAACGGDDGNDPAAPPTTVEACCYYGYTDFRGHPFTDCSAFSGPAHHTARFFATCDTVADRCESVRRTYQRDFVTAPCDFKRCGTLLDCTPDGATCNTFPRPTASPVASRGG